VAPKFRLKLAARAVLSADAGLLVGYAYTKTVVVTHSLTCSFCGSKWRSVVGDPIPISSRSFAS